MASNGQLGHSVPISRYRMKEIAVGEHIILELHHCQAVDLSDTRTLRQIAITAARKSRATVLEVMVHRFHPKGASVVVLLAESHLALHTWPELKYVAADIFTCGANMSPEEAGDSLVHAFRPSSSSRLRLTRRTIDHYDRSSK